MNQKSVKSQEGSPQASNTSGAFQDDYDLANILHTAGKEADAESRALQIIRKIQTGQPLDESEKQYEITSPEELQGLLLPTQEWQRKYDQSVRYKNIVYRGASLDRQINQCLHLLTKDKMGLANLPHQFDWCENNSVELLHNEKGKERFFARLLDDLRNAKRHIHIAMFGMKGKINNDADIAWQVAQILAQKAAAGVEVKLILDAKGCGLTFLGRNQHARLLVEWMQQRGIHILINHSLSLSPNHLKQFLNFDHRKLFVIDGEIGYCGGMALKTISSAIGLT